MLEDADGAAVGVGMLSEGVMVKQGGAELETGSVREPERKDKSAEP